MKTAGIEVPKKVLMAVVVDAGSSAFPDRPFSPQGPFKSIGLHSCASNSALICFSATSGFSSRDTKACLQCSQMPVIGYVGLTIRRLRFGIWQVYAVLRRPVLRKSNGANPPNGTLGSGAVRHHYRGVEQNTRSDAPYGAALGC